MSLKTVGAIALASGLTGLASSALTAQHIYANYKPELDFYQHRHDYSLDGFEEPKRRLGVHLLLRQT